jgi:hypothetical protein
VVELSPNCPWPFLPQHFTPPPDNNAQVWLPPAVIAVTPLVSPFTSTGILLLEVELFPNCPLLLFPQHFTPPPVVSDVPIVAAERLIYKVNGVNTSFSEMLALPNAQLDTTYWFPWYNNVDLDTQLRFGVP